MRPLLFNANDEESAYLEENKISWSEYCHENLARSMNNQKYINAEKYQVPFVITLVGVLVILLGYSTFFSFYLGTIFCFISGVFCFVFGIFSLMGSYKNGR
jgi:tRNA(Ile)-lysidine synthase TilS/MesJ